jgi:hypothetical protein
LNFAYNQTKLENTIRTLAVSGRRRVKEKGKYERCHGVKVVERKGIRVGGRGRSSRRRRRKSYIEGESKRRGGTGVFAYFFILDS